MMANSDVFGHFVVTGERVGIMRFQQAYQVEVRDQRRMEIPSDPYKYMVKIGVNKFVIVADTPLELKTRRDNFLKSYRAGNDIPFVAGTIRVINEANWTVRYI